MDLKSHRSPNWSLRWDDEQHLLMAEAGDDERFGLSDIDADEALRILDAWNTNSIDSLQTTSTWMQKVHEKLRILGAVTSGPLPPWQFLRIFALAVGDAAEPAVAAFQSITRDNLAISSAGRPGSESGEPNQFEIDLTVIFRSGGSYADLLEATQPVASIPHLLIDASFHHTISLGPLVAPGISACLQCLTTRLGDRWAETAPPPGPVSFGESRVTRGPSNRRNM